MVQSRRLRKSREEKMLFGVAGGVAEHFDLDPVLVRAGLVLLAFATGGAVILAYIVMAIIMPDTPRGEADSGSGWTGKGVPGGQEPTREAGRSRRRTSNILAGGLIVVGVVLLLNSLGLFGSIEWDIVWSVAIIALGLALLIPRLRE